MKRLDNSFIWILIIILASIGFFWFRTARSGGGIQYGELVGLIGVIIFAPLFWFIARTERWKELNQQYNINRIFFILLILALVIAIAIFYIFFWGV